MVKFLSCILVFNDFGMLVLLIFQRLKLTLQFIMYLVIYFFNLLIPRIFRWVSSEHPFDCVPK